MGSAEAQIAQNCVRHGGCLHLEIDPLDLAFRIDQKCVPHHPHILPAHEFLQPVAVVAAGDWAGFRISQKGEGEFVFGDELGVGGGTVLANAQHMDSSVAEAVPAVSEIAGLLGATRGVVFWIEIENNPLAFQVRELYGRSVLIQK